MLNLVNLSTRSDVIGAAASVLCFIHCLATPFLFVAHAGLTIGHESHPWWWGTLDIIFLAVSFFAVYWSTRNTSKKWIKYAFWFSWFFLLAIVLNEKVQLWHLSEGLIYPPTLGLISLHFYNRRYCRCENDNCCVD